MFAGGTLSWFVIMPMIALFGGDAVVFPGSKAISALAPSDLWGTYVKYIGAGAVATGGIISLIKSFPLIVRTFKQAMKGMKSAGKASSLRTEQDIPMPVLIVAMLVIAVAIWLLPAFPVNLLGALIVVVFGFFFATVSSRMVGLIGSSNNPVSGMAIATIIITTILLKATGTVGTTGMTGAICIGGIICVIAAIAVVGCICGSDYTMLMGAMVMGPLAGWVIKQFDKKVEGHIPAGFEMLINNFSIGILGMLLAILGYYVIGPFMTAILTVPPYSSSTTAK